MAHNLTSDHAHEVGAIFQPDDAGASAMYNFQATGDSEADGARVFVVDIDGSARVAVATAAESYGEKPEYRLGRAVFVSTQAEEGTDREQRDATRAAFEDIIARSEVPESEGAFASVRDRWSEALDLSEKAPILGPSPGLAEARFYETLNPEATAEAVLAKYAEKQPDIYERLGEATLKTNRHCHESLSTAY